MFDGNPEITATTDITTVFNSFQIDTALQIVFLCLLAGYIVYAVILHYHWRQYSASTVATWWTFILFAGLTLPLLLVAGLIALSY